MRTPHNDPQLTSQPVGAEQALAPLDGGDGEARPERLRASDVASQERPRRRDVAGQGRRRASDVASQERRCILSGEHDARGALVRLALSPDGQLLPDIMARAPGRGAWIGVDQDTLAVAISKGKLKGAVARAHKGATVQIASDLPQQIAAAFQRHFLAQLGLAAKSGVLIIGAERIDQAARSGRVALLGHAADAAEDGRRKRDQSWRVGEEREGSTLCGVILPVDRSTLSVALGRDNVVHIAITDSAWAERIKVLLDRWHRFAGSASGSAGLTESQECNPVIATVSGDSDSAV